MTEDCKNDRESDCHQEEKVGETAKTTATISDDRNGPARPASPATKTSSQFSDGSTNHPPSASAVLDASAAPLPRYHDPTWTLLSQGAEARVWLVPSFASACIGSVSTSSGSSGDSTTAVPSTTTMAAVCKERFPKRYRHPTLDAQITKSRTKAECKCLVRCRKAGVPCPTVLGVDMGGGTITQQRRSDRDARSSTCIFLEVIKGRTVREFFQQTETTAANTNHRNCEGVGDGNDTTAGETTSVSSSIPSPAIDSRGGPGDDEDEDEVRRKRNRVGEATTAGEPHPTKPAIGAADDDATTRTDEHAVLVAGAMGTLIARMHDADVVHGDLTTSNVMLSNAPPPPQPTPTQTEGEGHDGGGQSSSAAMTATAASWSPELTLIDFGLASVAGGGSKKKGATSSMSSVEEKAVDLYVLERAFLSTHPGSEGLVAEMIRTYKKSSKSSDAVLQRLFNVRQRGRKRECFG